MQQTEAEAWRTKLSALDVRLRVWQQAVKQELEGEFTKLRKLNRLQDLTEQQNAVRMAMARAGDGPRRELNGAIDELCLAYLRGSSADRIIIRAVVQESPAVFHDLWGYIHRAAEEMRAGGGQQWFRMGLAIVSIEDQLTDYHDTVAGLIELHQTALEQRVDPKQAFSEIASMSNSEAHEGRPHSTRELLLNFDPAEMSRELEHAGHVTNQR